MPRVSKKKKGKKNPYFNQINEKQKKLRAEHRQKQTIR
jgi:hypothetical protein